MPAGSARATPPALSLAAIVDAAEKLVAAEGIEGLSMRKLAKTCGVGAMTLYGYVPTKDDLLAALGERLLADLAVPGPTDGDWAYRIAAVFHALRRAFLDHPALLPIAAAHRVGGLTAYRGAEIVLGALREAGLDDGQSISALTALTSFTVGACQRQVGLTGPGVSTRPRLPVIAAPPSQDSGHVARLAGRMAAPDFDVEYSAGLDLLITGLRGWLEDV